MKIDTELLSHNIKHLRMQKGWSQEDLAADIHIARSTYSTYETGLKVPDLQTIDALAAKFDIGFEGLVSYDLRDGLVSRIYLEQGNEELVKLLNDYQNLSVASKNLVVENLRILLEREYVFYESYAKKKGLLQEQPHDEIDGDGNSNDGNNGT